MGLWKRNCMLQQSSAIAPNPSPRNYIVLSREEFPNAVLLKVKYIGCTNYEGIKVMVYPKSFREEFHSGLSELDPHFQEGGGYSPIARFEPSDMGISLARKFCQSL